MKRPDNIALSESGDSLVILDQTRLPSETVYLELKSAEELFEAISRLRVRGWRNNEQMISSDHNDRRESETFAKFNFSQL